MDPKEKASEPSILLCLPLEIRREIYRYSLLSSQNPSAKTIYLSRLPVNWRDPFSPLLLVNGQVRDEVIELVQTYPITLRVTHHGAHFDGLAETCFIAQQRPRDYSKISHLCVDIWPPHLDRPVDIVHIWRHLRRLRTELRDMPLLEQVSFFFKDNEMATWTVDGKPLNLLKSRSRVFLGLGVDDVTTIMGLFCRVKIAKATLYMPPGLAPGQTTESIRDFLQAANAMMMGHIPVDEDAYNDEDEDDASYQDWIDEECELELGVKGAEIARDKLDAMTNNGTDYFSYIEWDDFIEMWTPNFGLLYHQEFVDEDDLMEHYVKNHDIYDLDDPYWL